MLPLSRSLIVQSSSPLTSRCSLFHRRLVARTAALPSSPGPKVPLIQSLDLDQKVEKLPVRHPLIAALAIGKVDRSILQFPQMLEGNEKQHMKNQAERLRQQFAQILIETPDPLRDNSFNDLWRLSATESVSVFEAMGQSRYGTDAVMKKSLTSSDMRNDPLLSNKFNSEVIGLMLTCLTRRLLSLSDNPFLKKQIDNRTQVKRTGFAWCEKQSSLGSVQVSDWKSEGKKKDANTWLVSGSKTHILHDDYDEYLIFCKTANFVPENVSEERDRSLEREKKTFGVTAFLLSKDRIDEITEFVDSGVRYQRLSFPNLMLTTDDMIFAPSERLTPAVSSALTATRLSVAAFVLGRIKATFESVADIVISSIRGEETDPFAERYLTDLVLQIFELESVVYYTAGIMDSFEDRDLTLEGMLVKALANDYSHSCSDTIQRLIGCRHRDHDDYQHTDPIAGPLHDCFEMYSSFMECPLHAKILSGLKAFHLFGQHGNDYVHRTELPLFNVWFNFKERFRDRDQRNAKPNLDYRVFESFVPELRQESDILELCIKRFEWQVKRTVTRGGRKVGRHQLHASRAGQMATELLMMLSVLCRTDRSLRSGIGTGTERSLVRESAQRFRDRTFVLGDELHGEAVGLSDYDSGRRRIHRRSIHYNGYFPFSPLDKVIY